MEVIKNQNGKYNLLFKLNNKQYICSSSGNLLEFDSREDAYNIKLKLEAVLDKLIN